MNSRKRLGNNRTFHEIVDENYEYSSPVMIYMHKFLRKSPGVFTTYLLTLLYSVSSESMAGAYPTQRNGGGMRNKKNGNGRSKNGSPNTAVAEN